MSRSRFTVPDELTRAELIRMLIGGGEADAGPLTEDVPGPLVQEPGESLSLREEDLSALEALPESVDEIDDLMGPSARFGAYQSQLGPAPPPSPRPPASSPPRPASSVIARVRAAGGAPSGAPVTPAERQLVTSGTFKGQRVGAATPPPPAAPDADPGLLMERGTWRGAGASPFGAKSRVMAGLQALMDDQAPAGGTVTALPRSGAKPTATRPAADAASAPAVQPARMISPAQADRGNAPGSLRLPGERVGGPAPLRARDLGANPNRAPLPPFQKPLVNALQVSELSRPALNPPTRRAPQDIALPAEGPVASHAPTVGPARMISPAQAERGTKPAPIQIVDRKGDYFAIPGHTTVDQITEAFGRDWKYAHSAEEVSADLANVEASARADPHPSRTLDRTNSQGGTFTRDDLVQLLPALAATAASIGTGQLELLPAALTAGGAAAAGKGAELYLDSKDDDAGPAMQEMALAGLINAGTEGLLSAGTSRFKQGARNLGLNTAKRVLGPDTENVGVYAQTALDEGVLPGLRTGNTYAKRKMRSLHDQVGPAMASHGQTPVPGVQRAARVLNRYSKTGEAAPYAAEVLPRTTEAAERVMNTGDNASAREAVSRFASSLETNPMFGVSGTGRGVTARPTSATAQQLEGMGVEQAGRRAGHEGTDADLQRALAQDFFGLTGTAVPSAQPTLQRMSDLVPVQHLLGTKRLSPFLEPENTPTIRARLTGHALNRAAAPLAKAAYRVSKISPGVIKGSTRATNLGLGALLSGNQTFADLVGAALVRQLYERQATNGAPK